MLDLSTFAAALRFGVHRFSAGQSLFSPMDLDVYGNQNHNFQQLEINSHHSLRYGLEAVFRLASWYRFSTWYAVCFATGKLLPNLRQTVEHSTK
jgi:hypothetical protein